MESCIQSAKTRPGADCGSDHELLIAKFGLKLKKVGGTTRPFRYESAALNMPANLENSDKIKESRKTTRPFGYDLNQIPYDYTVEVRNRFKGLDLIDRKSTRLNSSHAR